MIILQDVPFSHLTAILEFMYAGEVLFVSFNFPLNVLEYAKCFLYVQHCQVNVAQEQLPAFLKTAEKLKIKGLAEGTPGSDD